MAGSHLATALTLLAGTALAVPLTGSNLFEKRADPVCQANSGCVPFTIDVTWGTIDATGAGPRGGILTNGSFPGPPLRLKVGECVDFLVINNLGVETGVHFHGIQQTGTPWADGVPGLSQYAIQSGDSYMHRWTADEVGAYFYHSHYKGQIMDGLYGAIFISPSDTEPTPFSAIDSTAVAKLKVADAKSEPIFISDWSKYTFDEFYSIEEKGNVDIACADSIILNGIGSQYCLSKDQITAMTPPQISALNTSYTDKGCIPANTPAIQGNYTRNLGAIPADVFNTCTKSTKGKNYTLSVDPADGWASITFINPSGFSLLKATIDSHKLYVYEYNGRYITPQTVDQVTCANGERVSFFIKLDQPVGDYTMRISNLGLNQIISGFGVVSYKGSKGPAPNAVAGMTFGGAPIGNLVPFVPALAAPLVPEEFSKTADKTFKFQIQKLPNAGDAYRWTLQGNTAYDMSNDDGTPLLYKNPANVPESDIVKKTNMGDWVDIIMQTNGPIAQPHPIHKHANKFFAIGQGTGSFTWNNVAEAYAANSSNFNFVNPPYLDGYTTLPGERTNTWTVLRYKVEIAGAWFLHCHMQTHLSGGMAVAIMDGVDKWPTVPSDAGKVCQGKGSSNSTWTPSCYCPASCPANSGKPITGTGSNTGSGNGIAAGSVSSSSTSTSSASGSWSSGIWTGSNNPASPVSANAYSANSDTGSYSSNGNSTTSGSVSTSSNPVKAYTGAASAVHVSSLTLLAVLAAALSL